MKLSVVVFVAAAAALLLSLGAKCEERPGVPRDPWPPVGPDSTWTGAPTVYQVVTTIARDSMRYVVDWSDAMDTTEAEYASQETASVTHTWTVPGTVSITVQAVNAAFPDRRSDWSPAKSVTVIADGAPVVDSVLGPPVAVRGEITWFAVYAHDPDGDSIRATVALGDSMDTVTVTSFFQSPAGIRVSHVFPQVETAQVVVSVQDRHGATSLPDTLHVPVGYSGVVGPYRSILRKGNMTVTSRQAALNVAGHPEGPLTSWPKWQHDLCNTGYVGGGR